jgi:cytochrome P450
VTLVAELVGLPPEGRERMLDWASGAFNALAPVGVARVAHGMTQLAGMAGYFEDPTLVERLRPGSWAARLDAAVQAGEISRKEFATLLQVNYILPALDTTIHATSNMIWLLAQREDVWAALRNNRALVPRAVHEALRLEGPVQAFSRVSVQEAEIGGSIVPAGKRLFVSFASAGRDERHYRNPETFDIERPSSDHLALGYGPHVCLGRNLATLEMSILLSELLERVERLSLVEATRQVHNSLRGFDDLRVALN